MKENEQQNLIESLPARIAAALIAANTEDIVEIRLRRGLPASVKRGGRVLFISKNGLTDEPDKSFEPLTKKELSDTLSRLSEFSLYSRMDEIKRGSFTVKGGHRVGICVSRASGEEVDYSSVSSVTIRVARQIIGCAEGLFRETQSSGISSLLLVSPPLCGKTTVLRDLIRISASPPFNRNVAVVDERHEIAGLHLGERSFDLGLSSDILDGWRREQGVESAVRSLSPDVVACDEIGCERDVKAVRDACTCGVKVFATAHAADEKELSSKSTLHHLISGGCFKFIVFLTNKPTMGTIRKIKEFD